MATLSPSNPHPSRAPPPFLFSGPPSGNASAPSLNINPPSTSTSTTTTSNNNNNPTTTHLSQTPSRAPLLTRSRSSRGPDTTSSSPLRSSTAAAAAVADVHPSFSYYGTTTGMNGSRLNSSNKRTTTAAASEGDRATDALWKEMQATLADVEVSAFHSTHVFGQAHATALEELRAAQIKLAQAWGRDVGVDAEDVKRDESREKGDDDNDDDDDDDDDDDEGDILVARRRREANERFFEKVREGVRNVVGRLEGVAEKMGKLETESREIWGGEGSVGSREADS